MDETGGEVGLEMLGVALSSYTIIEAILLRQNYQVHDSVPVDRRAGGTAQVPGGAAQGKGGCGPEGVYNPNMGRVCGSSVGRGHRVDPHSISTGIARHTRRV